MNNDFIIKISKFDAEIDEGISDYYDSKNDNLIQEEDVEQTNSKLKSSIDELDSENNKLFNLYTSILVPVFNDLDTMYDLNYTFKANITAIITNIDGLVLIFKGDNTDNYKQIVDYLIKKLIKLLDDYNQKRVIEKYKNFFNFLKIKELPIERLNELSLKLKEISSKIHDYKNEDDIKNDLYNLIIQYKDDLSLYRRLLLFIEHIKMVNYYYSKIKGKFAEFLNEFKEQIIKFNSGIFNTFHMGSKENKSRIEEINDSLKQLLDSNIDNFYDNLIDTLKKIDYFYRDKEYLHDSNIVYNKLSPYTIEKVMYKGYAKRNVKNIYEFLCKLNSKHVKEIIDYLKDLIDILDNSYNVPIEYKIDLNKFDKSDDVIIQYLKNRFDLFEIIKGNIDYTDSLDPFDRILNSLGVINVKKSNVKIDYQNLTNIKQIITRYVLSILNVKTDKIHRSKYYSILNTILKNNDDILELIYLYENKNKFYNFIKLLELENISKNDIIKISKSNICYLVSNSIDYYEKNDMYLKDLTNYEALNKKVNIFLKKDISAVKMYEKLIDKVHSLPMHNTLSKKKFYLNKIKRLRQLNDLRRSKYKDVTKIFKFRNEYDYRHNIDGIVALLEVNKSYELLNKYNYNKIILDTNVGDNYITIVEGYGFNYIKNNLMKMFDLHETLNKIVDKELFLNNLNLLESNADNINKKPSLLLNDTFKNCVTDLASDINKIKTYEEYKKYYTDIEKKIPELKILNYKIDNKLQFRVLETGDIAALDTVGKYTNCCQRLGSAGEAAAIDSFINKYASVLVLYYEGKILSQSYFHYVTQEQDPNGPGIILDNVERNLSLLNDSDVDLDNAYKLLANNLKQNHPEIKYFRCGLGYNKLNDTKWSIGSSEEDHRVFSDKLDYQYSDYNNGNFLDLFS